MSNSSSTTKTFRFSILTVLNRPLPAKIDPISKGNITEKKQPGKDIWFSNAYL